MSDAKLDEVLDRLDKLEQGQQGLKVLHESHIDQYHPDLPADEAQRLIEEHGELRDNVSVLLNLVAGRQIKDPITHEWMGDREPGMAGDLSQLRRDVDWLKNEANGGGGVKARIKTTDAVKIAMISAVATIVTGLAAAWAVAQSGGL